MAHQWKMLTIASLLTIAAAVSATVVPIRPERKIADAEFLKRQKAVLDLFVGIGHNYHFKNEHVDFDIMANVGSWTDEKYPKAFMAAYHNGMLTKDSVFTMSCPITRKQTHMLFDLFYFAKDFDTFHKVAMWAKHHVHPGMFVHCCSMAIMHRSDCHTMIIPPMNEVMPNLFVPAETMHMIMDARMTGMKEGRFNYNNTGYEYTYHRGKLGQVLGYGNTGTGEHRMSYFREDLGLNNFYAQWTLRNPAWMCPEKYNKPSLSMRGENFLYMLKQMFARYTLERISNGLPFTTVLKWVRPMKVGYNPRLCYLNGKCMYVRPDNIVPMDHNIPIVQYIDQLERRIWDTIASGMMWESSNKSMIAMDDHSSMEMLGRIIYGTTDRPTGKFYGHLYYKAIDALAHVIGTGSDRDMVGNALSTPLTTVRDPIWYNLVTKLLTLYGQQMRMVKPYHKSDLMMTGVTVQNVEMDKLLTYFDMFDYEATNGVPMVKSDDYNDHRYMVRQYRLNHKPYTYKVTVKSDVAGDAMVRVFIGPKTDSDDHMLNHEQARFGFFEIDRFPVKMTPGANVWERSSSESPMFVHDQEGFRGLYNSINNAMSKKEQFYISEAGRCGLPERLQLPMGWKGGRTFTMVVVVTPYDSSHSGMEGMMADIMCGGSRLNDGRTMGFPFDRPLAMAHEMDVPNILFKDIHIYHKDAAELNRPTK